MTTQPVGVVIAAGGLGTRVNGWSPFLPKEFRPVEGSPGLLHVLSEAAATGIQHAVVVHPYYTPFIEWTRTLFTPGALARYQELAQQPVNLPFLGKDLRVDFIAQRGRYADITSALNGTQHLRSADVCLLFSDNVDPSHAALSDLVAGAAPDTPAVLASPFNIGSAPSHGVILCTGAGPVRTMAALIEKPDPVHAEQLAADHGPDNLRLLLGRVRMTPGFLHYMAAAARRTASEPRLSLALAAYARHHHVDVTTHSTPMADLGAPEAASTFMAPRQPELFPRTPSGGTG